MCQLKVKTGVGGLVAFHTQTRAPTPPCEPAKGGQVRAEAAAQVHGVGAGRAAEGPATKAPPGAGARRHLLLPGQIPEDWRGPLEETVLFFPGKSIRPTLIGPSASPPWGAPSKGASWSLKISFSPAPVCRGGTFPCQRSFSSPCPRTALGPQDRPWAPGPPLCPRRRLTSVLALRAPALRAPAPPHPAFLHN